MRGGTRAPFCSVATVDDLIEYLRMPPTVYINASCLPASPPVTSCPAEAAARDQPARIVDIFLFFAEVDTLEIRLHELDDLVDLFVLVQSDRDHHGVAYAPFASELFAKDPRFTRFSHKVEVITVHDWRPPTSGTTNWAFEHRTMRAAATYARGQPAGTLIIFGHSDEVPARSTVWKARHCDVRLPLNVGAWFPPGDLRYAYRSDWPAQGHPFTLGDPLIARAEQIRDAPSLLRARDDGLPRGKMTHVLLGGFHASSYCYPPAMLLKALTATEHVRRFNLSQLLSTNCQPARLMEPCRRSHEFETPARVLPVGNVPMSSEIATLPWLLACNPRRFPSWFGKVDQRMWAARTSKQAESV